MVNYQFTSNTI